MTREEAIEKLTVIKHEWDRHIYDLSNAVALDMAIKALEQEPCDTCKHYKGRCAWLPEEEQEPCEDAVSRLSVKDEMLKYGFHAPDMTVTEFVKDMLPSVKPVSCIATVKFSKEDIQELVNEKMKDIVVERKKGKWIRVDHNKVMCSECEITHLIAQYPHGAINYCPNCGADMKEVEK